MNKRSFLLIFLFTISMFFIHYFFVADRSKTSTQIEQTVPDQEDEKASLSKSKGRIAPLPLSSLPIVEFYEDEQGNNLYGHGVTLDNTFLIYPKEEDGKETKPPTELFVKNQSSQDSLQPVKQYISSTSFNNPLLYTISDEKPTIVSFFLPYSSYFQVQLITFENGDGKPSIISGFYENGRIGFYDKKLNTPAIVFAEYEKENYLPVGFYEPEKEILLSFSDVPKYARITTYKVYKPAVPSMSKENYYVLENDFQQIAFSNLGGAIAEINLPFKSKTNSKSVVLPIEFDRIIQRKYPENAFFPLQPYYTPGSKTLKDPASGGYHPLIRRDLSGSTGRAFITPARLYALNIVSDDERDLAQSKYTVTKFEKNLIEFQLVQPHRKITKTFSFVETSNSYVPYTLKLDLKIEGDSKNLYLTSGVPEVELISGSSAPDIKYRFSRNQKSVVEKIKLPKNTTNIKGIYPDWVSNANGFFGLILDPLTPNPPGIEAEYISGTTDPTRLSLIDAMYDLYPPDKYPGYITRLPIKPTSKVSSFNFFGGPYDQSVLKAVDTALTNPKTGYSPKYSEAQSFHGWFSFISEPFAKFLMILMNFFYNFSKSWALSIILITIVLRILLYPLNNWSIKSMTKMQMLAPEVEKIKKRYAKDPKRVQVETMQLYKSKGANPFSGCLPMIIQMPFLIGMFDLLKSAFPLRGTPFIPGWINNLAAPDVLFSWSYPIFFFGTEFHLLPFILGGMMLLQQKITSWTSKNKEVDPNAQKQTALSGNIMTIVFTLMFYNFPSGLNIYWISSTFLGIIQQFITTKQLQNVKALKNV